MSKYDTKNKSEQVSENKIDCNNVFCHQTRTVGNGKQHKMEVALEDIISGLNPNSVICVS